MIDQTNQPLAPAQPPGTPLTPAPSNAQRYAILDETELAQYQRLLSRASGQ
ncbi:MAG: hypothetical protein PHH58_17775 [Rhodoferax sp.]|nr:hypothetical protein [Rhodoferax sp.]